MSEFGDSDSEFENLRLISPRSPEENEGFSDRPLQVVEREFDAKFSGSFLEANLFGNGGFGGDDVSDEERRTEEKEEFVGLDWDASRIFKNLACPENNSENAVCVLRLHDVLTKCELGVIKMNRQMINCGRLINGYTPETRQKLGFDDAQNIKNLLQMIRSLRANINLMLIETDDLQELIQPKFHGKNGEKSGFSKGFWISGVALVAIPAAVYFYRKYC
ncbi:unnamed protein product [Caenorhabditis brenneri]